MDFCRYSCSSLRSHQGQLKCLHVSVGGSRCHCQSTRLHLKARWLVVGSIPRDFYLLPLHALLRLFQCQNHVSLPPSCSFDWFHRPASCFAHVFYKPRCDITAQTFQEYAPCVPIVDMIVLSQQGQFPSNRIKKIHGVIVCIEAFPCFAFYTLVSFM